MTFNNTPSKPNTKGAPGMAPKTGIGSGMVPSAGMSAGSMSAGTSSGIGTGMGQGLPNQKCRVMLVDDSLVVRGILRKILISDPDIQVVASVGNGKLGVEELDKNKVDAVILDIEMPIMDGITALPLMLKKQPNLVVLVASTLSQKNADISMKCLALGAKDYIPKPTTESFALDEDGFRRSLIEKVKMITATVRAQEAESKAGPAGTGLSAGAPSLSGPAGTSTTEHSQPHLSQRSSGGSTPSTSILSAPSGPVGVAPVGLAHGAPASFDASGEFPLRPLPELRPDAIVIGSSTGGPQALATVLQNASSKIKVPIFIAQHMPPLFTKSLATHLEKVSGMPAKEGEDGDIVKPGHIYVAPGDFHMEVVSQGNDKVIKINKNPPENFCRPSVNPLLRSAAKAYPGKCLGAMLTGLGADGIQGTEDFTKAGCTMIAQDKATSVVWGMPAAVSKAGFCAAILPLNKIGSALAAITTTINPRFGVKLT